MEKKKIDWRLYTALYYLNKGLIDAFYNLLLVPYNAETQLNDSEDMKRLNDEGYINYKSWNSIFITNKSLELLKQKQPNKPVVIKKTIKITNDIINDFVIGFPSSRYGKLNELKSRLENFVNKNDYSIEIIMKAKNEYIKNEKRNNYMYTMNASNFVIRELDNYCRFITISKTTEDSFDGVIME